MGAGDFTSQLGAALFGKSKRALLALFYGQPEHSFYLRQITRTLGIGQGSVQRELARLVEAGLLVRTRVGSQVHYQANAASPVFSEIKALMVKTAGVARRFAGCIGRAGSTDRRGVCLRLAGAWGRQGEQRCGRYDYRRGELW